jgi:hypothetical protein
LSEIKEKLVKMKKSQVWLLQELRKKGIVTQPQQLCNIINGVYTYPKAKEVLSECETILAQYERESVTH